MIRAVVGGINSCKGNAIACYGEVALISSRLIVVFFTCDSGVNT